MPYIELRHTENSNKYYKPHRHSGFSIGAISKGEAIFYGSSKKEFKLKPKSLVMLNPETIHACNPINNMPRSFYILYFSKDWILRFQKNLFEDIENYIPIKDTFIADKELFLEFINLCKLILNKDTLTIKKEESIEYFLNKLFSNYATLEPKIVTNKLSKSNIEMIKKYFRDNITNNPTILDIANRLNLSTSHIIRDFKANVGITPYSYLINLKIEYAKSLLKSGMPIADVAYELALSDQSHLNRLFKQYVACTPGEYIKALNS